MDKETGRQFYRALRQAMEKRYGANAGRFLTNRICKAFRRIGYGECIDNFRVAETSSEEEVGRYNKKKSRGCCAFWDEEVTYYPTGQTFQFGFNYGH